MTQAIVKFNPQGYWFEELTKNEQKMLLENDGVHEVTLITYKDLAILVTDFKEHHLSTKLVNRNKPILQFSDDFQIIMTKETN